MEALADHWLHIFMKVFFFAGNIFMKVTCVQILNPYKYIAWVAILFSVGLRYDYSVMLTFIPRKKNILVTSFCPLYVLERGFLATFRLILAAH
jgi:hypothetical protein